MQIFNQFCPEVRQVSIDEAFLNMSGTQQIYGDKKQAALVLKKRVQEQTGLTISVGIGPTRLIAKMASDYNKPDRLCIVDKGMEQKFVDAVGIKKLWGVGKVTQLSLEKHHIKNNEMLREYSLLSLQSLFGKAMGMYLYSISRGIDPGIYTKEAKSHSISTERTFLEDIFQIDEINQVLLEMSGEVMERSLSEKQMAKTVGLKIRYGDFTTFSCQITPSYPIYNATQLYTLVKELMDKKWNHTPIRLIGVGIYQTYRGTVPMQQELFDEGDKKKREIEKIAFSLKRKGLNLTKASLLHKEKKNDRHKD
jgi:DNA polymerase-4